MDRKPIVLYLRMKGMGLDVIHDDLVHTLGKYPVAYSIFNAWSSHNCRRGNSRGDVSAPAISCSDQSEFD
jgi:hypothetical protein